MQEKQEHETDAQNTLVFDVLLWIKDELRVFCDKYKEFHCRIYTTFNINGYRLHNSDLYP